MLAGATSVSWLADVAMRAGASAQRAGGPGPLNELAAMVSFLLLFGIFSYTESSGDKGIGGFPHRLFTLPVSSLRLVAVPVVAGIVGVELLYLVWMGRLTTDGTTSPRFVAVLLAAFMVFYQTILWTLTRVGALRLVVLGATAIVVFAIGMIPSTVGAASPWRSERFLGGAVAGGGIASFLLAWNHVARARSGGQRGARRVLDALVALIVDRVPGIRGAFASPSRALFWYEWRSAGTALPVIVGGVLLLVAAPLSWFSRDEAGSGMAFLIGALLTPIAVAVPVGLAFGKPVLWSEELSIPPFVAVRPLSAADIVATRLKVAALATVVSWLAVFGFLAGWLLLWGNVQWLSRLAIQIWAVSDRSVFAVFGIAALVLLAGMLLTWRFLIAGLWSGLSGNRRLYHGSAMAVVLFLIACMLFSADRLPGWVLEDPARMVPFVWGAAIAVIAKYWLAARTWRHAAPGYVRRYLAVWLTGTATFLALGMLLWRIARIYLAIDILRLQSLLILLALLVMPVARVGLTPVLLEQNRHRR